MFDPDPLTFEDFERIPHKHGFKTRDLAQGVSSQQILNQVTPFLQSWLFSGLIVQILGLIGVTLCRNEFVRTQGDGKLVITAEALPKYFWFWLAIRHHQPRHETEDHAKLADSCLELANRVINKLASHEPSTNSVEQSAPERVLLSLTILGETLCYARDHIIRYSVGPALH